jgi:hypothetical protein
VPKDPFEINMDIDVDRLIEMVDAASDFIQEYLQADFSKTKDELVGEVRRVLETNRASVVFFVEYNNTKMNDLVIRIDPRRKRISVVSPRFRRKRIAINGVLSTL